MRKMLVQLLMITAVIIMPQILAAQDRPKPQRPNPESMFKRLDTNKDGVITAEEIPTGMPERMKQFLIRADKNGNKQLALEELKAAFKARKQPNRMEGRPQGPAGRIPEGRPGMGPPPGFGGFGGPGMGPMNPQGRPGMGPPQGFAGRTMGMPQGPAWREGQYGMGPPQFSLQGYRANLPELPNVKVIFRRLDTDKDGELSFDEFKVGMMKLHRLYAARQFGNPPPANRFPGRFDDQQTRPWLAMRPAGWEPAGIPGPQFRGPGPQFYGRGMGYGPQFGGYAMGQFPGGGPKFHAYAMDWSGGKNRYQVAQAGHKKSAQGKMQGKDHAGKKKKAKTDDKHGGKKGKAKKPKEKDSAE